MSDYLDGLTNFEREHLAEAMRAVTLERMQQLCERLGQPQRQFRSILISGTNGKGSTAIMTAHILAAAGLRVGLYTSPHLRDVRERIQIGGRGAGGGGRVENGLEPVGAESFEAAVERVRLAAADGPTLRLPTFFEAVTAAAFSIFAQERIDIAVLEVGLGGRLDATNVAEPAVSILTPIGLDHMDILGPNTAAIAREKAGIFRAGGVALSAPQPSDAAAVIRERAAALPCRLVEVGSDVEAEILAHTPEGLRLNVDGTRGRYEDVRVPLLGRHQALNATLAIAAVELLSDSGAPHAAVAGGLGRVSCPGRIEMLGDSPVVLVDGGHNAQAAAVVRATIEELWPDRPTHLLVGMSKDKPITEVGNVLAPIADTLTYTQSAHPRAADPRILAEHFGTCGRPVNVINDPLDAYTCVLNTAAPGDVILVTGSIFLIGELRETIQRINSKRRSLCPS